MDYDALERLDIHLGDAPRPATPSRSRARTTRRTRTAATTCNASTYVDSGNGADHFNVETISGPTFVETGAGDDIVRVGSDTGSPTTC